MKRLFALFALLWALPAYAQDVGYYVAADCATLTPVISGTICLQNTTVGGLSAGTLYKYDSTGWTNVSASVTGAGHAIKDEAGADLTTRSTLNFTGNLVAATDNGATSSTDVTIAIPWSTPTNHGVLVGTGNPLTMNSTSAGTAAQCLTSNGANADPTWQACATNPASNFVWSGTHSFIDGNFTILGSADPTKITRFEVDGQTGGVTRVWTGPDASTRLLGDSDFSTTGIMSRTAASTYAGRTLTGTTGNVVITNGNGVSGNPTFDLGTTAVQTDQSNTFSTGDQSFAAANSLTLPTSTNAAPTVSGRCAYDSIANLLKCGFNGSTLTLATTNLTQPLATNLTALTATTGANNAVPVYTSSSAMTTAVLPSCADSGGNHLNWDATLHTWSCGTSSTGGLSGLTINKFLMATGATSADTSGNLSQSGGVVNASSGFTVGATPFLVFDTSGIAASDKTWTVLNFSGTVRPSTGALTAGHVLTTDANGLIIDGGAAGAGTWTDNSSSVGTNKTLVDAAAVAGTGNSITVPIRAFWDAGGLTVDGTNCTAATSQTINSGPTGYFFVCADSNSSTFDGSLMLPQDLVTATFTLTVNDVDSSSQHFAGAFKAMCRNSGTTVNNTWGTGQTVDITMTTANNNYTGTTSAVTPNGACSAGATLFWRYTTDAAANTDDGDARVIGVLMKQAS